MIQGLSRSQLESAAAFIRTRASLSPKIALILGSGLGALADAVAAPAEIPYAEIPHWPIGTVAGHVGRLLVGRLQQKPVIVLQGRAHFYEGHDIAALAIPARVLKLIGVETLIVTNAAGGINANYRPGDLMVIKDHINFPGLAGHNPLRGPNEDSFGPRFPDMTNAYDPGLRQLALSVAKDAGVTLHEGTYAFVSGPNYETPGELRLLHAAGADAVGMSTVPTVVVAHHAGIRVLGFSSITNLALPDPPPGHAPTHDEVLEMGQRIVPNLTKILNRVISLLPE